MEDAYEKLYNKAKETDSDIVSGKPNILMDGYQREVAHDKKNIWVEEKTITDLNDFTEMFYDVFYWNKIYRRSMIEENKIYMIPGKLYADVPLVFKAYLCADKISLITDEVYYWRKRSSNEILSRKTELSVSNSLFKIENMEDRLETFFYLKNYFYDYYQDELFNKAIKKYMERFFYPIFEILIDESFEEKYLNKLLNILKKINNVYQNDLSIEYNLYIYFILNNQIHNLKEFLSIQGESNIISKNDNCYWGLKFFDNPQYNIPNEFFKIKHINSKFINIGNLYTDDNFLHINNISVPKNLKIISSKILLIGLTKKEMSRKKNTYSFDLCHENNNVFYGKVFINDIKNFNVYDFYLEFVYEDNTKELIRLNEKMFKETIKKHKSNRYKLFDPFFTNSGNLSLNVVVPNEQFIIIVDNDNLIVKLDSDADINYNFFIKNNKINDKVYFDKVYDNLEIKWKYSIWDFDLNYKIYCELNKNIINMTTDFFYNFTDKKIKLKDDSLIEIFKNPDKSISIVRKK